MEDELVSSRFTVENFATRSGVKTTLNLLGDSILGERKSFENVNTRASQDLFLMADKPPFAFFEKYLDSCKWCGSGRYFSSS